MRNFHMFDPRIWKNLSFQSAFDDKDRLAYFYAYTSHHQTMVGAYHLPDEYAAKDLGWDVEVFRTARQNLQKSQMLLYDEDTEEVFVVDWFPLNLPNNKNHYFGTRKVLETISSDCIHDAVVAAMHNYLSARKNQPLWFTELDDKGLAMPLRQGD